MKIVLFWFRRDLRLNDNTALIAALKSGFKVIPLFIFDEEILNSIPKNDPRVQFIYQKLEQINSQLLTYGSALLIKKGSIEKIWQQLIIEYQIAEVYFNKDYEPYARQRDKHISNLLIYNQIKVYSFKDQVIFEESEILKKDGNPYTVFTPYKNAWLNRFKLDAHSHSQTLQKQNFFLFRSPFPSFEQLGFQTSAIQVIDFNLNIGNYAQDRDFPQADKGSYLSPHLRFGTVSIREIILQLKPENEVFLSELIWREFFMQILFHFPKVVYQNFRAKYDGIKWRNNPDEFKKWQEGKTGFPLVDAGMRQLNQTGYMHNRVRMIAASFLVKHLLVDWRLGEAYFADKLLDFELAANNGNWQWAAGTGCDAAPYFRIFNPTEQLKKFDKELKYIKQWIPEYGSATYCPPMVDHKFARQRALEAYRHFVSPD